MTKSKPLTYAQIRRRLNYAWVRFVVQALFWMLVAVGFSYLILGLWHAHDPNFLLG
jgi:hypothetical protein